MIRKGASGTAAMLVFIFVDANGDRVSDKGSLGNPWNDVGGGFTNEVGLQLLDGDTYADIEITRIVNFGNGDYGYMLEASETAAEGMARIRQSGVNGRMFYDSIVDTSATLGAGAITMATFSAEVLLKAFGILDMGTAQAGGGSQGIKLRAGASANGAALVNGIVLITANTGVGQLSQITDYDGVTKLAAVADPWGNVPDATSEYVVFAASSPMAAAMRTLDERPVEGSATLADLTRGIFAMVAGKMLGMDLVEANNGVGDVDYYAMNGIDVRVTITYSSDGRPTINITNLAA